MELIVDRLNSALGATLGNLSASRAGVRVFSCYTVEDEAREVVGRPVSEWKVMGRTAIPRGTYDLHVTLSTRFKCALPLLLKVPGFSGIRIHKGNTQEDTEGCILPGMALGGDGKSVLQSEIAFNQLFTHILDALNARERITITIR